MKARLLPDRRSRKLMNSWAKGQEVKVSKSDIWLFCVLLGNAFLVISRKAASLPKRRVVRPNSAESRG
jgi:hypothetical protein